MSTGFSTFGRGARTCCYSCLPLCCVPAVTVDSTAIQVHIFADHAGDERVAALERCTMWRYEIRRVQQVQEKSITLLRSRINPGSTFLVHVPMPSKNRSCACVRAWVRNCASSFRLLPTSSHPSLSHIIITLPHHIHHTPAPCATLHLQTASVSDACFDRDSIQLGLRVAVAAVRVDHLLELFKVRLLLRDETLYGFLIDGLVVVALVDFLPEGRLLDDFV